MKISTKLVGISLASVVIVTGLVTALLAELKSETTSYNRILQGPVQDAEAARRGASRFQEAGTGVEGYPPSGTIPMTSQDTRLNFMKRKQTSN